MVDDYGGKDVAEPDLDDEAGFADCGEQDVVELEQADGAAVVDCGVELDIGTGAC